MSKCTSSPVVEWLWDKGIEIGLKTSIHAQNELFLRACQRGHLLIAEWLWNKGIEIGLFIDIHTDNNEPFRMACWAGHIHIIEWLWNKGVEIGSPIDIHAINDYVFHYANKSVLYLFKMGLYPNIEVSTDLYRLWKSGTHSVQIAKKSSFLSPYLNEIVVNYI